MRPARNDTTITPPLAFPEDASQFYCEFIYRTGSQQGRFSDISVSSSVQERIHAMHRIVMVRSPMLYRLLMEPSSASVCQVDLLSINIPGSSEALHTALGHLYRPLLMHGIEYTMLHKHAT